MLHIDIVSSTPIDKLLMTVETYIYASNLFQIRSSFKSLSL